MTQQTVSLSKAQSELAIYCKAVRNLMNFSQAEQQRILAEAKAILKANTGIRI